MKDNSRGWTLVIGILVIVAIGMFAIVATIRRVGTEALAPIEGIQDVGDSISTQVSEVLNPTPTIIPDPITIVNEIRDLARLETVQYSVERVITAETGQGIFSALFGDRLLFVAHGVIIAGVDLQKLGADDLWVTPDGALHVRLPAPEIFISTLDNDKSYVYDRDTGLLTRGNADLESEARRVAEEAITEAALEDGILNIAGKNAQLFFSLLLGDLGYDQVIFEPAE